MPIQGNDGAGSAWRAPYHQSGHVMSSLQRSSVLLGPSLAKPYPVGS
jgi:hypothetical protein